MAPTTPYTADLAGQDPLVALHEAAAALEQLVAAWTPEQFERRIAPGKWTARKILIHLAQSELAFGVRVRTVLTVPDVTVPSFEQDGWMALEADIGGGDALELFAVLARANRVLYGSLSVASRQTGFTHTELGKLTVDWVIYQQAGHLVHHWKQLEALALNA